MTRKIVWVVVATVEAEFEQSVGDTMRGVSLIIDTYEDEAAARLEYDRLHRRHGIHFIAGALHQTYLHEKKETEPMTLDDFIALPDHVNSKTLLKKFARAYRNGVERDPAQFPLSLPVNAWWHELNIFEDVGGDADDPLEDEMLEPAETPDCQPSNPDECPTCRGGRCVGEPS